MPIGNSNYEILDDDRLLGESVFYRDNQLVTGNGSLVSGVRASSIWPPQSETVGSRIAYRINRRRRHRCA